jgi:glycosyltransferase involved in cell wall biosynthesis
MVGDAGKVVPPRVPALMAEAWRGLMECGPEVRQGLANAARERVMKQFSLSLFTQRYESLYRRVTNWACGNPNVSLAKPQPS